MAPVCSRVLLVSMEAVADFNARVAQGPLPDCYKGQPRLVVLVEMFEQLEEVTRWCRELREFVAAKNRRGSSARFRWPWELFTLALLPGSRWISMF